MKVPGLDFHAVNDLAIAAASENDLVRSAPVFAAQRLGPLMEVVHLRVSNRLPESLVGRLVSAPEFAGLLEALERGGEYWVAPDGRRGMLRLHRDIASDDTALLAYELAARRAAQQAGFMTALAGMLVAASTEMINNAHEHSQAASTCLASFDASSARFEFVVADQGIGPLQSLRSSPEFRGLSSHGAALRTALMDGCSRHGPAAKRGLGFQPIFRGLANRNGVVRCRAGDHSLTIDGQNPTLKKASVAQTAMADGFFIAVACAP